ncbi:DUF882 domain-containing protein [Microvirga pudoricolor]|uniref:DUF882 domain-containing protein n=1 Tax=Microvirga pudoricolor TaxID=2778729 RepID=UPI001E5BF4BE|nr:DUF882 domain-containing protein [Microvirga pudoricolor]
MVSMKLRRNAKMQGLRVTLCLAAATTGLLAGALQAGGAAADGDTRSLTFFHTHTRETATITFRRNGSYDERGLEQLNWLLRDWRVERQTKMDPRLFDILWEAYRESGSSQPIHVVSAYRSPETNGALRRRSSGVSEHSQHMLGKAMDVRFPDVDTARLRGIAMKMQYGGVGYYASSQFVHVDTGSVRAWPRMTQDQLARLFPDGRTLHLPSNGKPLQGYEEAKAEILSRNASLATQASAGGGPSLGSALAALFGRRNAEPAAPAPQRPAEPAPTQTVAVQLASAEPDAVPAALSLMPLPPRRPKDAAVVLAAVAPPAPPADRIQVANLAPALPAPKPPEGLMQDPVKSLFAPYSVSLTGSFSTAVSDDLSSTRFSGPAVKPVSALIQAQADL